ncbi:MAG: signal peptidase I [Clostridiales bacterium]|jgi:signal peptidase I|nr:signal peptidase I [Clostridiales bacterium]
MAQKKDNRPIREKYRIYFAAGITAWIIFMFIHPVGMTGNAMSPTIEEGQIVMVMKDKYKTTPPEVFSVVNFRRDFSDMGEEDSNKIRRVVGIQGDTIEIRNGKLYRNGELVDEPYAVGNMEDDVAEITLEKGEIFVLGDNREESLDSRHLGPLPMSDLRGTCTRILWPLSEWGNIK